MCFQPQSADDNSDWILGKEEVRTKVLEEVFQLTQYGHLHNNNIHTVSSWQNKK